MSQNSINESFQDLLNYCRSMEWRGYDPYDGLNSKLFQASPLSNNRLARLVLIQFCKRSPINFRKMLYIEKGLNPKGIGLFLSVMARIYQMNKLEEYRKYVEDLAEILHRLSSPGFSGICWGYDFNWQSRASYLPRYTPTSVASSFIANAFLDAYEVFGIAEYLEIARSTCDFIIEDLNLTETHQGTCFSYSPLDYEQVYNATMLASQLLSRVYSITKEEQLLSIAKPSVYYVLSNQNDDGSWYYGIQSDQKWIDSFHSGYVLVCLRDFINFSGESRFNENLDLGFIYYKNHMFLKDGTSKYYNNRVYPIDIHSVAQGIITFSRFGQTRLAESIATWAINNMRDINGYFYYQKRKYYTNKISYMRWSQAFMMKAFSELIIAKEEEKQL